MSIVNLDNLIGYVSEVISTVQDDKTKEEIFDYEKANNIFDIDYKKSYLKARKWVGGLTFFLVWVWLLVMIYFVISHGIGTLLFTDLTFDLSDAVIITLVTTTTINVVTFLTIVIKNLFPVKQ